VARPEKGGHVTATTFRTNGGGGGEVRGSNIAGNDERKMPLSSLRDGKEKRRKKFTKRPIPA
ncbi:hypothetical protein GWI33_009716, partial [Rhynchophorus ferrugineus]